MFYLLNFANFITLFRIIVSIFLIFPLTYLKYNYIKSSIFTSLFIGLFFLTDFLDGYIARKYNQETSIGKNLDPIADKISCMSTLIPLSMHKIVPLPITFLLLSRDALVGGMRQIENSLNTQKTINPSYAAKIKTALLMMGITSCYSPWTYQTSLIIRIIFWLSTTLSISTGYDYLKKILIY